MTSEVLTANASDASSIIKRLLEDSAWCSKAWNLIDSSDYLGDNLPCRKIGDRTMMVAGNLHKLLIVRLQKLLDEKVNPSKIGHWCWTFCWDNFDVMCCIICLQHHVEDETLTKKI